MRPHLTATLAVLTFASACISASPIPLFDELGDVTAEYEGRPQWPPPPATARIRYLGAISAKRDFEPPPSLWRRLVSVFVGEPGVRLVRPAAICMRGTTLAIADPGAAVVHLLDLHERRWRRIASTPTGPLRSPVGVACLPGGRFVVSDSHRNGLWSYDKNGLPRGRFNDVPLERPTGLIFDEVHGRLWVAETSAHRLRAFDAEGRELLRVGRRGAGAREFNYPTMLAADPDGGVWVTDSLNFRLQHVDSTGVLDRSFGVAGDREGAFARPRGVAVDASGRIFAVDALMDAVQIFDPRGRLLLAFGGRGTRPGQFWLPADVVLDGLGHVFVADSFNQRIQVFAYRPPAGG